MVNEQTQRLVQSRHYCIDRLVVVKDEFGRILNEGGELKTKLDGADEPEAGTIRRRRRYLDRRLCELKVERTALTAELQEATDKLRDTAPVTA